MGDVTSRKSAPRSAIRPDRTRLFAIASEQGGYFTAEQGRACGFGWALLSHHVKSGRFIRVRRGLYRSREFPSSPRQDVFVAWLAVGKDLAVVSHESALDLLDLSDVIPGAVHLTVPRSRRSHPTLSGVSIHTTTRPLRPSDRIVREGVRLTSAPRSILDAAEAGMAPEQIEMAVVQAISRGLAMPEQLRAGAREQGRCVTELIAGALRKVEP